MSITALKEVPVRFGRARIRVDPDVDLPSREGFKITLPALDGTMKLYPLLGGEQFVLRQAFFRRTDPVRAFFGGTDEQPFLVELRPEHLGTLETHGEAAFYESLKPPVIVQLEALFAVERTVRQGDIYAYPLPLTWDELMAQQPKATRVQGVRHILPGKGQVLGTRHTLDPGLYARIPRIITDGGTITFSSQAFIVEGMLEAPDHASRELVGPHLIDRSRSMVPSVWDLAGVGD